MPLFPAEKFAHYLAYLATDQETFRDLRGSYDGVLVPGTIAAWQQQGTGGFVLSLSATAHATPYVIDPRFPLFQQALSSAKQSHIGLAEVLGDPALVRATEPTPDQFSDDRLSALAAAWIAFNTSYDSSSNEKFDKYAARLGEQAPTLDDVQRPEAILAPYFVAQSAEDEWWDRSKRLYEATCSQSTQLGVVRVVAASAASALDALLADVDDPELAVWVSGLDEPKAPPQELLAYRLALKGANDRGQSVFALYGGFFSVLLASTGLTGAAHGVGFSEHRNWRELPKSGAPPARYYVRRWHRYVPIDVAQKLWEEQPTLSQCSCPHCLDTAPNAMTYHDLMKHSVICRQEEIDQWSRIAHADAARLLRDEYAASMAQIRKIVLLPAVRNRFLDYVAHLPRWVEALSDDA